jgi:hypothetical protein
MLNGTSDKRLFAENERGTGPATPVSPASSASEIDKPSDRRPITSQRLSQIEVELRHKSDESDPLDDSDAAEIEIEAEFRRKLMGLRRLRRRERAQALRVAREWRSFALNALRERRLRERQLVRQRSRILSSLRHLRERLGGQVL